MGNRAPSLTRDFNLAIHGDAGPWVTLIHGGLANSMTWGRPLGDLGQHFRVLTYDLRGYGAALPAEPGVEVADHARDLMALWDAVGVERSFVAGFSFGGMIGQELAVTFAPERIAGLILLSTAPALGGASRRAFSRRATAIRHGDGHAELGEHVARAFSDRFREEQPEIVAAYRRHVLSQNPLAAAATFDAIARFDRRAKLGRITSPTLIVAGDQDAGMGVAPATVMRDAIPNAEMIILNGRGHTIHLESPSTFAHLLVDFISRHEHRV